MVREEHAVVYALRDRFQQAYLMALREPCASKDLCSIYFRDDRVRDRTSDRRCEPHLVPFEALLLDTKEMQLEGLMIRSVSQNWSKR